MLVIRMGLAAVTVFSSQSRLASAKHNVFSALDAQVIAHAPVAKQTLSIRRADASSAARRYR